MKKIGPGMKTSPHYSSTLSRNIIGKKEKEVINLGKAGRPE